MAIRWRLKTYLATSHGIYQATAFQRLIVKKTGVLMSLANLCRYVNGKPKILPLDVIQLFCTTLACNLTAFCDVDPKAEKAPAAKGGAVRRHSEKNTPKAKRAVKMFPDPMDYRE